MTEYTMRIKLVLTLAAASLAVSCASLGDPFLLSFDVAGQYQSEAITAAGKDAYRTSLVAAGDVSASAKVQRYFEAALRYDPNNAEASRYLALVEDYRASRFSAAVKDADALLGKPSRSPDEEYRMLLAVRRASAIYPRDESAQRLVKSTGEIRDGFVVLRLAEVEKTRASVTPESKDAVKEKAYIDAFRMVLRVRDIQPGDDAVAKAYKELKSEIAAIVEKRLAGVDAQISKSSFDEAKSVLSLVKDLDSRIGGTFTPDIAKAEYRLYLAWARYHESRKEWSRANARIQTALVIQKGSEAVALQKRIRDAADAEDRGATFEAGLKNLDAYIRSGELLRAQHLLASLSKSTTTSAGRATLDQRRKKLIESIAGVYDTGVKAYRDERFKDAVAAFETVVAIDSTYGDAAEYLDKAKTKQKLLDQY
jgi:hypothetical protein